uniref:C2H2-type domain-containing protein n=1 Tax=Rhodosorus marinus TaxID=101924 RepID=A0A7S3EJL1_9RHOD|mmetsp:Transcript_41650/g.163579  ORF Transcript_41650/g.163579 Transcript_41650/m.163579 type:complete len:301 (+) Transcript_41650:342-1244(+)|eukprot:CAMPEP_0113958150 /NCGR_PEP_ID=MMETSP0011_2-20120614/3201_1 /TAXON_ID=101924 /ORGANISM="Rhodosorus marinus" /LENGTH=300 /DNA_ID=CAMNT_0000968863 /DNA_START=170 /DNA_END=1072 /DNA_ORIENTATION=+ /assembly_acc=CAM_ASM_000156
MKVEASIFEAAVNDLLVGKEESNALTMSSVRKSEKDSTSASPMKGGGDVDVSKPEAKSPKTYECSHCHKQFKKRYNLKIHQRSHTGETPFECSFEGCSLKFKWRSSLINHLRYHNPNPAEKSLNDTRRQNHSTPNLRTLDLKPLLPCTLKNTMNHPIPRHSEISTSPISGPPMSGPPMSIITRESSLTFSESFDVPTVEVSKASSGKMNSYNRFTEEIQGTRDSERATGEKLFSMQLEHPLANDYGGPLDVDMQVKTSLAVADRSLSITPLLSVDSTWQMEDQEDMSEALKYNIDVFEGT